MKAASAALAAHIEREVTTLATCWRVERLDGTKFLFTDHDEDIEIAGERYLARSAYVPSAVDSSDSLSVDNLEIQGVLDSDTLKSEEIEAGLFDHASVSWSLVNWTAPGDGVVILKAGSIGEARRSREGFTAEVRGPAQLMQQNVGEMLTPTCRADLGDVRCTVDTAALTITDTVVTVASRRAFTVAPRAEADGYFSGGLLTWTSGANNGRRQELKKYVQAPGTMELFLQAGMPIAVGDTFELYPGCDKRWSTCRDQFSNTLHFRGEPFLPGQDALFSREREEAED